MSFIAVDLKVIEVTAPALARSLKLDPDAVLAGLVRLWHRCWSVKSATITAVELQGFVSHPEAAAAMTAFGLLESTGLTWRVKGADRYLRVTEQRAAAGRSRSSSAGRSAGRFTSGAPAADQRNTSGGPALTPNTEHRAPKKDFAGDEPPPPEEPKEEKPKKPRETDGLVEAFKELIGADYGWNGAKDGDAFAWLKAQAEMPEILRRWRIGLTHSDKYKQVRTVAQLRAKWNDLAQGSGQQGYIPLEHRPSKRLT